MSQLDPAKLAEVLRAFRDAEAQLKRSERLDTSLSIPSVNELRYAGHHLVEALAEPDLAKATEELAKAQKHALRACFDAIELEIIHYFETIAKFQDDYRTIVIKVDGLDYAAVRKTVQRARKLHLEARRDSETRQEYYARLLPERDALATAAGDLDDAREELNKTLASRRTNAKRWVIGTVLGLGAITAALVGPRCATPAPAATQTIASAPVGASTPPSTAAAPNLVRNAGPGAAPLPAVSAAPSDAVLCDADGGAR